MTIGVVKLREITRGVGKVGISGLVLVSGSGGRVILVVLCGGVEHLNDD